MIPSVNQYGAPARPAAASWIVEKRIPTPWASVLRHKLLAIMLFSTITFVGLVAALIYGREYLAEATIRVSPVLPSDMDATDTRFNSDGQYHDFVQEQVFEIDSYANAVAALDLLGPRRTLWQVPTETDRQAAESLAASLKVGAVPDSYLVTIDLKSGDPTGLADIVNAVAQAYLARTAKRELDGTDVGFQLLKSRQTEIEQSIGNDQQELSGLTQVLGVSSVEDLVNPYDKQVADSNAALARARREVLVAQAHLDAVKTHRQRIKDSDVEAKAEEMVAVTGSETTAARQQLIEQREQALVELSGLGPNHPGRPALQAQIATTNRELANLDQSALIRARSMLSDSEQATTSVDISEAQAVLEQAEAAEQGIERELDGVKVTAASFGAKYSQAVAVHEKLERERKDLQDVQERVSLLRLKSQAPGAVSLDAAALAPDMPLKNRRRLILALFGLAALTLAVGVPTFIDLIDRKIKSPAEFEALLGFPPLGVAHSSNGAGQHAMRRIALGIMREWRTSGIRSFVLTSVRDGANSSLALALADELTDLGVRTLAIEASIIGPNQRQLKGPSNGTKAGNGAGRVTKRMVARVANTGGLDVRGQSMPQAIGDANMQRTQNGAVIAHTFGYVRETVDRVLGNHDIVLLAAPPLLSSADTVAMIHLPAGAILVARAGHDDVSEIASAVRELERCVPPVVGAVFCENSWAEIDGEYSPDSALHDSRLSSANRASYGLSAK
jgi:uncharacterized protein involved in exopolysaccharide biosynthesis